MAPLLEIEADASAQRAERRRHWALYRHMSLDTAEEFLRQGPPSGQLAGLQEFLLIEKRRLKARLETAEKEGDFREKSALPIAVGIGFVGGWLNTLGLFPSGWSPWVTLVFNIVGALVWYFQRRSALNQVTVCRRKLAHLGKVD